MARVRMSYVPYVRCGVCELNVQKNPPLCRYSIATGVCWTEPGTMNVPGVHKSELIKKTFQLW
jgi:hypothetical protein